MNRRRNPSPQKCVNPVLPFVNLLLVSCSDIEQCTRLMADRIPYPKNSVLRPGGTPDPEELPRGIGDVVVKQFPSCMEI